VLFRSQQQGTTGTGGPGIIVDNDNKSMGVV